MVRDKVKVTIYRFTGKQLFFTVPDSYCEECDLTIRLVKQIAFELDEDEDKVEVVVKPWFNYLLEALFKGGWHPPIVMVDGERVSQGVVPDAEVLRKRIMAALDEKRLIHDPLKTVQEVRDAL